MRFTGLAGDFLGVYFHYLIIIDEANRLSWIDVSIFGLKKNGVQSIDRISVRSHQRVTDSSDIAIKIAAYDISHTCMNFQ